jgi:hypothetical protein
LLQGIRSADPLDLQTLTQQTVEHIDSDIVQTVILSMMSEGPISISGVLSMMSRTEKHRPEYKQTKSKTTLGIYAC